MYDATMSGILSGAISVVVDNAEMCKGKWAYMSTTGQTQYSLSAAPFDLSADWVSIYGNGYYVARVLRTRRYARCPLTGILGTVLHVDFANENNTRGNMKGVADDNNDVFKGSVYN